MRVEKFASYHYMINEKILQTCEIIQNLKFKIQN